MLRACYAAACLAAFCLTLGSPLPAEACSVCLAGDPVFSTHGTSAQQEGDLSLYIQLQGWRKDSGLLPHEEEEPGHEEEHEESGMERNRSQRLDMFLSWTPTDRFTVTLDVPIAFNEIEEIEEGESQTNRLKGLGDVAITGSYVLWRDREVLPSTSIEGRFFLKAPTGRTSRERGGFVDPHLQTGTGSWDFGVGVSGVHRFESGSFYASAFYRENTEADFDGLDYEYGDVVLLNAAVEIPLGHALGNSALDWITIGGELNFRWADFDRVEGERFDDSGGTIVYATPSVRMRLPFEFAGHPVSARLAVQIPVSSSSLNGFQDEKEVWSVGLFVPF